MIRRDSRQAIPKESTTRPAPAAAMKPPGTIKVHFTIPMPLRNSAIKGLISRLLTISPTAVDKIMAGIKLRAVCRISSVIPDASINCRIKSRRGNTFIDAPRFVMEVLSPSTEKYDRGEKKELYRQQEIDEYWIVDLHKKQVEIYELDYDEKEEPQYYLWKTVTEEITVLFSPSSALNLYCTLSGNT